MTDTNELKPWMRQPGEPSGWYLRFKRYCRLGPSRSILGLYNSERVEKGRNKVIKTAGAWVRRAEMFNWVERAASYDKMIDEREQKAWDKRRAEFREREVKLADSLIEKAEQMLQFPLATTKQESHTEQDGRQVINNVFLPARWRMRDAAAIIDTADKLMRLALLVETNREIHEVVVADDIDDVRRKRWDQIKDELIQALSDNDEGTESDDSDDLDTEDINEQ